MELETTCTRCGEQFTPSHDDYIKGVWRTCPDCRDSAEPARDPPKTSHLNRP